MTFAQPHSQAEDGGDYSPAVSAARPRTLRIPEAMAGLRLDQALAELLPEYSRNRLQQWVRSGRVRVDGADAQPKRRLLGGETVAVAPEAPEAERAQQPQALPLAIVHEDDDILVIDKPAGLVVHPGSGNWDGTLLNALLHHAAALARLPRAGIVHRLDKDTSGLLVVAKTLTAQTDLVRQLQARSVRRDYLALVRGRVDAPGVVDAAIGRHPQQRTRMAVVSAGRSARTRYRVLERYARHTLLECSLDTGRTHQIRVHLAHIGHPLVGDPTYGGQRAREDLLPRQALHAHRLGLLHPASRQPMHWESAAPADLQAVLAALR